jgi:DNA-binding transcriptional ArsR family regulator
VKSTLLLHPVRLRIVQEFLGRGELTTGDLGRMLPDVATATLYRQLTALLEGGVLRVVDERRVRGATERTYTLESAAASVDGEAALAMTPDQHRGSFLTFVAGLLSDFDRYLSRNDIDLARDLVGYRHYALHLTNEEHREFLDDLRALIKAREANKPGGKRTRRVFTTIVMPSPDPKSPPDER